MKLDLTEDEALVLFEWLAQVEDRDVLSFEDPAERQVLWSLHAQLEKKLVAPFHDNYRDLVERARKQVCAAG